MAGRPGASRVTALTGAIAGQPPPTLFIREVWYVSASPGPNKAHSRDNAQAHIFRSVGAGRLGKLSGGLPVPIQAMPYALVTDPSGARGTYMPG